MPATRIRPFGLQEQLRLAIDFWNLLDTVLFVARLVNDGSIARPPFQRCHPPPYPRRASLRPDLAKGGLCLPFVVPFASSAALTAQRCRNQASSVRDESVALPMSGSPP